MQAAKPEGSRTTADRNSEDAGISTAGMGFFADMIDNNIAVLVILRQVTEYSIFVCFIFTDGCCYGSSIIFCNRMILLILACHIGTVEREINGVMGVGVAAVVPNLIDLDITGIELVGDVEGFHQRMRAVPCKLFIDMSHIFSRIVPLYCGNGLLALLFRSIVIVCIVIIFFCDTILRCFVSRYPFFLDLEGIGGVGGIILQ